MYRLNAGRHLDVVSYSIGFCDETMENSVAFDMRGFPNEYRPTLRKGQTLKLIFSPTIGEKHRRAKSLGIVTTFSTCHSIYSLSSFCLTARILTPIKLRDIGFVNCIPYRWSPLRKCDAPVRKWHDGRLYCRGYSWPFLWSCRLANF